MVGTVAAAPTERSDEELATLARRDPEAFGLLYDRYADAVFRYSWRRLGSREDAEDATSQIFTRALVGIGRYRAGSFRSWLFSVAHNHLVDRLRNRRPEQGMEAARFLADPEPTPEEAAIRGEARRRVHDILSTFPAHERDVVELRLAGLTDKEIAPALGLSYGYVRVLQHRAATRLRAQLAERPEEVPRV